MDINLLRERGNTVAFTVSELNNYIKSLFENNRTLTSVTVKGEISNFTNHRSGHLYFSLKDSDSQIRAVMFRSAALRLKFVPESGMKVIIHGSVNVFARDGSYQIYVSSIQPDGVGALYLAYEQLKSRLEAEGLFDENNKKPIPELPKRIGVITSPTGAAVRDILNVTGRRYPLADIYIYPALVQGEGAEATLIRGVDYFDRSKLVDVIIIGRGGGSIEDLWAFNSEALARRIFTSEVPVISAVGHETDYTICDFVSDLRAPTPSAAAELAVPDMSELMMRFDIYYDRCSRALARAAERAREKLERFDKETIPSLMDALIAERAEKASLFYSTACECIERKILELKNCLVLNAEKTNAMSPLSVLSRGYSIVERQGCVIKEIGEINPGDEISVKLAGGSLFANVTKITEEN